MSSPTIAPPPAAPDYAEASREGIYTDIETLPIRRQIDQASQLGQRIEYTDPETGETRVADFTGLGNMALAEQAAALAGQTNADIQRQQLALRQELGLANAQQTAAEIRAADPLAYDTRQELTQRLRTDLNGQAPQFNDAAGAAQLQDIYSRATSLGNPQQLAALQAQLAAQPNSYSGEQINALAERANALRTTAADPTAANRINDLYAQTEGLRTTAADPTAANRINDLYAQAEGLRTTANDPSASALNLGLQQAVDQFNLGGKLDANVKRDLLNEARAAQAARGNYLGDAAALVEAQELGSQMENRQAQRLATLLGVQQQAFGQNAQLRGEEAALAQQRLATLGALQGQSFGQNQSLRGEESALAQQRLAALGALQGQSFGQNAQLRGEESALQQQQLAALSALQQQGYSQGASDRQESIQRIGQQANLQQQNYAQQAGQLGMLGQLQQQGYAQRQQQDATNYGRTQQQLANVSAMVLGQPITNQFGSLGAAQQGAVGYNPIAGQSNATLNPNAGAAGAGFAQQNFGTQSSNWGTNANIQAQGSPWMALLGQAVGGAAGGATAALI